MLPRGFFPGRRTLFRPRPNILRGNAVHHLDLTAALLQQRELAGTIRLGGLPLLPAIGRFAVDAAAVVGDAAGDAGPFFDDMFAVAIEPAVARLNAAEHRRLHIDTDVGGIFQAVAVGEIDDHRENAAGQ